MKYLRVDESGEITELDEISVEDHESVEAGVLEIIWFNREKYKRMQIGPTGGRYWTDL